MPQCLNVAIVEQVGATWNGAISAVKLGAKIVQLKVKEVIRNSEHQMYAHGVAHLVKLKPFGNE